jgi:hypothetical protein
MSLFRKELFKMPHWLKPELNTIVYWVHLVILATVALWLLEQLLGVGIIPIFTVRNIIYCIPMLAISDGVAHTLLQMD